jgi:hypothetical protein
MTAVLPVRRPGAAHAAALGAGRRRPGMAALSRRLTVVGLACAVIAGATGTATATFSEKGTASTVQVSTATLAPVDGLELKFVVCDQTTVSAQVEWRSSPAPKVSGYRVTAHLQNGQTELISQAGPGVLEVDFTRNLTWLQGRPTFTVTVLTSYGWTSVTPPSGVLTC